MLKINLTAETKERRNAERTEKIGMKRLVITNNCKKLGVMKAKEGMRVLSKLCYLNLREYKQRKRRHENDPYRNAVTL